MDLGYQLKEQRDVVAKTFANHGDTLGPSEVDFTLVKVDTAGGHTTLTLPVPTADMEKQEARFINTGANNLLVTVVAGFGGAGGGSDTLTLIRGEMAEVMCDGAYWYALHHSAAG